MIKKNTTTYSIIGSLGVHMFFTLGAGSFLMNINKNIQLPKPYKLEFVKRKEQPPVKKEKIRKESCEPHTQVHSGCKTKDRSPTNYKNPRACCNATNHPKADTKSGGDKIRN